MSKIKCSNSILFSTVFLLFVFSCKDDLGEDLDHTVNKDPGITHIFKIDDKEIKVIEKDGVFYYDHDMTLTSEQMDQLRNWNNKTNQIGKGSVIKDNEFVRLWPDETVNYIVGASYIKDLDVLQSAMKEITDKTGIKFKLRTNEVNYVKFNYVNGISGNSPIGMTKGGEINIGYTGSKGTIMHEIMHTLGVYHEQTRDDREEHIFLPSDAATNGNWGIIGQKIGAFDTKSLMLYSAFLKPDHIFQTSNQFGTAMSPGDILAVNFLYPKAVTVSKIYRIYSKLNAQFVVQGIGKDVFLSQDNYTKADQAWTVESVGTDKFIFRWSGNTGMVLTTDNLGNVKLAQYNTNDTGQQFTLTNSQYGRKYITSVKYSNKVLKVSSSTVPYGKISLSEKIENSFSQQFVFVETSIGIDDTPAQIVDGGIYTFVSAVNNSSVIDIPGSNTSNGTTLIIWEKKNTNNQKWRVRYAGDGYYVLKSLIDTTKVMTVQNAATANGTAIEIRSFANTASQKWILRYNGNGYYRLRSSLDYKSIDVAGGSGSNGTKIQLLDNAVTKNQDFKMILNP